MRKILLLFNLIACSIIAMGQQITIDECISLAKDNYPQIKQYGLIDKITEYNISNISKGYLPQIGVSAQATWQNAVPSFPDQMKEMYSKLGLDLAGLNKDQYKISVDVSQSIWDGGNISSQKSIATAESLVSKASLEVELYNISDRVNNLFFGILLLEEKLQQNNELLLILESNKNKIESLIKNGVAMESDSEKIMVEILSTQQQRIHIESSIVAYRMMLSQFIAKDISKEKLIAPSTLVDIDKEGKRPEIELFNAQRALLGSQMSAIKSSLMPRIGAFAQGFYGNPGFNMFDDMIYNKWNINFIAGVKIQWNIGGLYTKSNNINKIKTSQQRIDYQEETFNFNNNMQATQAQEEIKRIAKTMENDNDIIKLRKAIRKASESKLDNGIIDVTDLLLEITNENQAVISNAVHKIEYIKAIYNLKQILNN